MNAQVLAHAKDALRHLQQSDRQARQLLGSIETAGQLRRPAMPSQQPGDDGEVLDATGLWDCGSDGIDAA